MFVSIDKTSTFLFDCEIKIDFQLSLGSKIQLWPESWNTIFAIVAVSYTYGHEFIIEVQTYTQKSHEYSVI